MKRPPADAFQALVQSFFVEHMRLVRGASDHTIRAYRDALTLFLVFLAKSRRRSVAELCLDDIRAHQVLAFLNHIETTRGNAVVTRNCRLAAIRSFTEHLLRHDVTRAEDYGRILAIPNKRAGTRVISYLEPEDVSSVIGAISGPDAASTRDRALLLLLYNTGARVSEALAVRPRDLRLDRPRQVRLYGKGRKERVCPLWNETAIALRTLSRECGEDEPIFRNLRGHPLTRDGVAHILAKHVRRAAESRTELRRRRITPHVMRHSCAVALLQSGVDVTVIRDYLGHASVATTSRYITTNLDTKRKVLQAFWARAGLDRKSSAKWRPTPKLLAFLASL